MRMLILMRGAPGCGKSTWIKEHGLSDYALSADAIRGLFASPELVQSGKQVISQRNDKVVWETLFQMLERRMQRGDFTIVDACNSKTSEMKRYKALADQYRYRIFCVDMTNIPIEEAIRRNESRIERKIVPVEYLERVYSRFETQQIPSGITQILPEDFESVYMQPFDLSEYDRVVHIGDIHGCYDALQKVFGENPIDGIDPKTAYVFIGDYGDRGYNTPDVLKFLMEISQLKNVCLLEGNHEAHLWAWANDKKSRSREFEVRTKFEIEAAGISKTDVRKFYRRLRQCSYYIWRGKTVLCTHGGVPSLASFEHIDFVPSYQMIKGVGAYEDMEACAESFEKQDDITYQVFGHRNIASSQFDIRPRSIVLENAVERGGALRVATLSDSGWDFAEYVSDIAVSLQPKNDEVRSLSDTTSDIIENMVNQMRNTPLIMEKKFGHISSFNFTRAAFSDKKWNDLTVRARGLYIDTSNMKIVARGYEKFFAVNERNETGLFELSKNLVFPIEVFKKENGFLGLLSYDRATERMFSTTKSSPDGDMAKLFSSMLDTLVRKEVAEEYLKANDVTMLFEVVHPDLDPHIIEYDKPKLFLLDIVQNTLNFEPIAYEALCEVAGNLGVVVKERVSVLNSWEDFMNLYNSSQNTFASTDTPIEGYVIRDADGFMVKMKTDYYTTWKSLRTVADKVYNYGYIKYTSSLRTPMMNYFYAFVKEYYAANKDHQDIITLRKLYEQSRYVVGNDTSEVIGA